jgi:hypothetical protein
MKIVSIAISRKKGTRKQCVDSAELIADHGLSADAHAGRWHRQVSFLAAESIENARERGLTVDFGDFAENIATTGIDWPRVPIGTRFRLGRVFGADRWDRTRYRPDPSSHGIGCSLGVLRPAGTAAIGSAIPLRLLAVSQALWSSHTRR